MSFPSKTKQLRNHHFDSEKWDCVNYRDDDIVIATAYKSGTTWMQNIVLKLIYQGRELPGNAAEMAPWVDLRVPPAEVLGPMLEGMPDRRQLKTHLPADALKYSEKAKYIYIGRDGRDCFMSLMNHWKCGNEIWYGVLNGPGLLGDPMPEFEKLGKTEGELFDDWISKGWPTLEGETDGWPFWSLFDNVASWWPTRDMPNVCFIHFNDMKADLAGSVRKIAAFLDIPILEDGFDALVESLTFASMKQNANDPKQTLVPLAGAAFKNGGGDFIHKGTNERWKGVLSEEQLRKYDEVVAAKLTPDCAAWLAGGAAGLEK